MEKSSNMEKFITMKKFIIFIILAALLPLGAAAQSSMTDEQIVKFVMQENAAGT